MTSAERRSRERAAFEALGIALCLVASRAELVETAAEGLKWRDNRIAALERALIRKGGDPWPKPKKGRR
jgi:hypothetical protein